MVDKRFAADQIARLIGLKFFPSERSAQVELVSMLTFAKNEVIAVAVINEWLESQSDRPTPADIRRLVADHNTAAEAAGRYEAESAPVHYSCRSCQDEGFYGGRIGGLYAGPWKWCNCFAAQEKRARRPDLVDEANEVREKLLKRFPERPEYAALAPAIDGYQGEF